LIHKVARIKDAKKAEGLGADIVGIIGYECGGARPWTKPQRSSRFRLPPMS